MAKSYCPSDSKPTESSELTRTFRLEVRKRLYQPSTTTSTHNTLLEAVRHFHSIVIDAGSRGTTAHAHQCCIFQGYPKAVPSRMKLTMREPASMTSYSNSVWQPPFKRDVSLTFTYLLGLYPQVEIT